MDGVAFSGKWLLSSTGLDTSIYRSGSGAFGDGLYTSLGFTTSLITYFFTGTGLGLGTSSCILALGKAFDSLAEG